MSSGWSSRKWKVEWISRGSPDASGQAASGPARRLRLGTGRMHSASTAARPWPTRGSCPPRSSCRGRPRRSWPSSVGLPRPASRSCPGAEAPASWEGHGPRRIPSSSISEECIGSGRWTRDHAPRRSRPESSWKRWTGAFGRRAGRWGMTRGRDRGRPSAGRSGRTASAMRATFAGRWEIKSSAWRPCSRTAP